MGRKKTRVFVKKNNITFISVLYYFNIQFLNSLIFSENIKDNDTFIAENNKVQNFKFNFNANNVFKYDSSDNESTHKSPDINNQMVDETKEDSQQHNLFDHKDTLFFNKNDIRFKGMYIKNYKIKGLFIRQRNDKDMFSEAIKFFSTKAASNDEFSNLRRELKTIVRMKIRNNERRRQAYGKKRKIKRQKKKYFFYCL